MLVRDSCILKKHGIAAVMLKATLLGSYVELNPLPFRDSCDYCPDENNSFGLEAGQGPIRNGWYLFFLYSLVDHSQPFPFSYNPRSSLMDEAQNKHIMHLLPFNMLQDTYCLPNAMFFRFLKLCHAALKQFPPPIIMMSDYYLPPYTTNGVLTFSL